MVPPHSHRVSRVRWYSGAFSVSFPISSTGFLPSLTRLPRRFDYRYSTPHENVQTPYGRNHMVWALPVSLAATRGIDVSFSSSGYLDVSVPPVSLPSAMNSLMDTSGSPDVGCPIRISTDQGLLAAPRSVSPLTASFVGAQCQGIRPLLFLS